MRPPYLATLRSIAEAAWARGLYVIIDVHQDGFSRRLARGCGGGFPGWAISPRARSRPPDNGCGCRNWVFHEVTDPGVHRSFADFYADTYGVRTRYLAMLDRIAATFATVPGVIGYDPLNEPWGDEAKELFPLYRDAAAALRTRHPTAILFLAGHATTGNGKQTRMPRPAVDNFAYSPHYYSALVVVRNGWHGRTSAVDRGFAAMRSKADGWGVPLFVGEFGVPADARRAADYISLEYDRLDLCLASGRAMERYTPHWNEQAPGTLERGELQRLRGLGGISAELPLSPFPSRGRRHSPPLSIPRGRVPTGRGAASRVRLGPPARVRRNGAVLARHSVPPGLVGTGPPRRGILPARPGRSTPDLSCRPSNHSPSDRLGTRRCNHRGAYTPGPLRRWSEIGHRVSRVALSPCDASTVRRTG